MHADELGSCNNVAHVSYTAETFSQLVVWQKMTNYSCEQHPSYGSLQQTCILFIYFPLRYYSLTSKLLLKSMSHGAVSLQ